MTASICLSWLRLQRSNVDGSQILLKRQSSGQLWWRVATERQSLTLALIGIALSVIAQMVTKEATMPIWITLYLALSLIILLCITLATLRVAYDQAGTENFPEVQAVVNDHSGGCILLLDQSPLFGMSTLVTVYHRNEQNGFEVMIGHGTVQSIQSDQRIQITIDEWVEGNDDIVSQVKLSVSEFLKRLVVRPSVARGDPTLKNAQMRLWAANSIRDELQNLLQREISEEEHAGQP